MKNQDAGLTSANNKSDPSKRASTFTSLEKTESGKLGFNQIGLNMLFLLFVFWAISIYSITMMSVFIFSFDVSVYWGFLIYPLTIITAASQGTILNYFHSKNVL